MKEQGRLLPAFLALFADLKKRCSNDPKKIELFVQQSPSLKETVEKLAALAQQIETALMRSDNKYHVGHPDAFPSEWGDFEDRWAGPVASADVNLWLGDLGFGPLGVADGEEGAGGKQPVRRKPVLVAPDSEYDEEYRADEHDPGIAVDGLINYLFEELDWKQHDDYRYGNFLRVGIQAWEYMTEVIGVNFGEIAVRWQMFPPLFVPKHVANRRNAPSSDLLYARLENAVRAFVFGAPLAAMAMCRALCEMVLKEHYGVDDKDLERIIFLAEARYPFIKRLGLQRHRLSANRVLHGDRTARDEEQSVLEFIAALKTLIEKAPPTSARGAQRPTN